MENLILDVVGGSDGSIRMFEFMHPDQITLFRPPGQNERVNKIAFNPMGNKVLYTCIMPPKKKFNARQNLP